MTTSVRLDEGLDAVLRKLSLRFGKKRSEIIRDAIRAYNKIVEDNNADRLERAVDKTKAADKKVYEEMETTLDDGI